MKSGLLLDGETFDPNEMKPVLKKIKAYLDSAPKNEMFSVLKLCQKADVGECSVRGFLNEAASGPYFHRYGPHRNVFFGHPEAVKEFKKLTDGIPRKTAR